MITVSNNCKNACNSDTLKYKEYISTPIGEKFVTGETIELPENTSEISNIKIKGDISQNHYVSTQLFDINNPTRPYTELTIDEDDWITIEYDNTNGSSIKYIFVYTKNSDLIEDFTNYSLVTEIANVSGTGTINVNNATISRFSTFCDYDFSELESGDKKIKIITSKENKSSIDKLLATYVSFGVGKKGSIKFRLSIIKDLTVTPETFEYSPFIGGRDIPNSDYPIPINVITGDITITSQKGSDSSNLVYHLGNNYLSKWDYIENGIIHKYTNKIDSYNDEEITTEYYSTTGGLDSGATIYYRTIEPELIEIEQSGSLEVYGNNTLITNNINTEMTITCETNEIIEIKGKLSATAFNDKNFIGTFNLKSLTFETENDVDFKEKEFEYYKQVNNESFKIGTFITTDVKDSDTNETVKVVAMDYGLKFATPYATALDYDSGNITMQDVLNEIIENIGIELSNKSQELVNKDFIVDSNQFVNNEVYGDVISAIAGVNGMFAIITDDDKLKLFTSEETNEIIEDYIELDDKRDTRPITIVQLGMSQVQGVEVQARWEEGIQQYGEHYLILNDNPFAYTMEKRRELASNMLEQVKGLGYSSFESQFAFKPYLQLGDAVKFRNKAGELVDSIVLKIDTDYDNITLSAPSIADATVDYIVNDVEQTARRAEIIANQATSDITLISKQVTNIGNTVESNYQQMTENFNNYYTIDQTNEMIINAQSGLTNSFSESGGNNIFRNTGLWFKDDNGYEYWQGDADRISEDNAVNNNAILIKTGSFSQEQDVPNGNYSINFYYQKLVQFADVKVIINDVEYELDSHDVKLFYTGEQNSETLEYITQPIVVNTKKIKIEFISDTDGAVKVYDLMCNKGSARLVYSQNENETTTDTVNISKGITITSTNMETIFKANADGIRITKLNSFVIAYFTDKGLSTKELIVEDEAQIVKTLWQEVGDQTWITRI